MIDRSNMSIAIVPLQDELQFDQKTKGLILSSFFYGYILTQVIGGYLALRFGGRIVLTTGKV